MPINSWGAAGCVALGGAVGSLLRYSLTRALLHLGLATPWPTLSINLVGSFVLGLVVGLFAQQRPMLMLLLGTGLCGGFTTFSTLSLELVNLLGEGRIAQASLLILASGAGGILAAALGLNLALQLSRLATGWPPG